MLPQNLLGLSGLGGRRGMQAPSADAPMNDTSEQIVISPLSLLKMLRHGKAGIPLEVMGLMLGDYVDDYTVRCIDVFSMPQSGTETTIESIDEGFQVKMVEMLKQTGLNSQNLIIGWYHSHPGFGCWLSQTDINTQKTFEQQVPRTVAVVVDPIQSVRGKVVIDAFRTYSGLGLNIGDVDQRQTTSNLGDFRRAKGLSLKDLAKISYYSILIGFKKNDLETKMLLNLRKSQWDYGLKMIDSKKMDDENLKKIEDIGKMALQYSKMIEGEINKTSKEIYMDNVGKFNPRDHLENLIDDLATDNLNQCLTTMLDNIIF